MQKIKAFGLIVILGIFGSVIPVVAQSDTAGSSQEASQNTATETTKTTDTKTTLADRLKTYQAKKTEKLAEAQAKRIATKCKVAQGKITVLRARSKNIVTNRKAVYKEIGEKLNNLVSRFQASGLDTTKLETAMTDIKADLVDLNTDMDSYDTVLSDLETMDCEADPDAFSATLSSARELQAQLRDKAKSFRSLTTNELKTIITELRTQLEQQSKTTGEQ